MTYLKVFTDFRELMEPLNAQEKGQLFEAMLAYAMDGAEVTLEGNERFIWPVARRTIDREAAAYESKAEANRANGRRGAEARWGKRSDSDRHEPDSEAIVKDGEAIARDSENSQEQDQEQKEEQDQKQAQEYVYDPPPRSGTHTPKREQIAAYCGDRRTGIPGDRSAPAMGPWPG